MFVMSRVFGSAELFDVKAFWGDATQPDTVLVLRCEGKQTPFSYLHARAFLVQAEQLETPTAGHPVIIGQLLDHAEDDELPWLSRNPSFRHSREHATDTPPPMDSYTPLVHSLVLELLEDI
ncbi:MAG TPA: hypothetical protein DCE42_28040 [Myxococcales bacterium]|nr:hypothetical protein [Deltaproteobacteria bacterium]MBU52716.1 hypothetical protein [Deltaproteobacteria bacterium]HAA58646.1 hypothetical protein [Myxococcales bacterium]|tara:strand:- start:3662 stop:4024 length:363 start_codon:yes stop_codon:yes gene_type:complete